MLLNTQKAKTFLEEIHGARLVPRANVLQRADLLLSHDRHDCHHQVLPFTKAILDLTKQVVVSWEPQVIFSVTISVRRLTNPSSDISMSWYSVQFT